MRMRMRMRMKMRLRLRLTMRMIIGEFAGGLKGGEASGVERFQDDIGERCSSASRTTSILVKLTVKLSLETVIDMAKIFILTTITVSGIVVNPTRTVELFPRIASSSALRQKLFIHWNIVMCPKRFYRCENKSHGCKYRSTAPRILNSFLLKFRTMSF
jgi:hypothetical protein